MLPWKNDTNFNFGHRPARQCLSEQNALYNLDSKKVTQQKRLSIMAMAGGLTQMIRISSIKN
jgi:hypothetical protein